MLVFLMLGDRCKDTYCIIPSAFYTFKTLYKKTLFKALKNSKNEKARGLGLDLGERQAGLVPLVLSARW